MKFSDSDYDCIILDLDNTLYNEYDFIELCLEVFLKEINYEYVEVSNWREKFHSFYLKYGNDKIFDNFIQNHFGISDNYLDTYLNSLREENLHSDDLSLADGVIQFLNLYRNRICIVTDGNIKQQIKKTKLLNIDTFLNKDKIFYSDMYNGKSSEEFRAFITKELSINKFTTGIVIGDNPKSDGILAENLNFQYYKINENSSFFREYM